MTPCTRELESLDFPVEGDELDVGVRLKVVRAKKEIRTDLIHRVYEINKHNSSGKLQLFLILGSDRNFSRIPHQKHNGEHVTSTLQCI